MFDDMIFWVILLFPVGYAIMMKIFKHQEFTWAEFAAQVILCMIIIVPVWAMGRYSGSWDQETWNGSVSSTEAKQQDCPSGWQRSQDNFCKSYHTRSVRSGESCTTINKHRSCHPTYRTEYNYDYSWERRYFVASENLDRSWEIPRVDPQGATAPKLFAETHVGDPASIQMGYENWVRGASASLFHEDASLDEKYAGTIPPYPDAIYDFFNLDRVLTVGVNIPDIHEWNRALGQKLIELGPKRQMNAIVLIVDASKYTIDYAYAVRRAWQGFKKNDAVIFIGVNAAQQVQWSEVLSWSKENAFNVNLRTAIANGTNLPLDQETIMNAIYDNGMASYVRRPMEEFEYLKADIPVPLWLIIVVGIFSVGGSLGLSCIMLRIDLVEEIANLTTRR